MLEEFPGRSNSNQLFVPIPREPLRWLSMLLPSGNSIYLASIKGGCVHVLLCSSISFPLPPFSFFSLFYFSPFNFFWMPCILGICHTFTIVHVWTYTTFHKLFLSTMYIPEPFSSSPSKCFIWRSIRTQIWNCWIKEGNSRNKNRDYNELKQQQNSRNSIADLRIK